MMKKLIIKETAKIYLLKTQRKTKVMNFRVYKHTSELLTMYFNDIMRKVTCTQPIKSCCKKLCGFLRGFIPFKSM
jgi:hypothetical protein